MEQQPGMNSDNNEESSTTDEIRSKGKPGMDSGDVDMKPASPGSHHPATTPTTPEASKKTSKRGKKIRDRLRLFNKRRKASSLESSLDSDGALFGHSLASICLAESGALPRQLMELLQTLYVDGPMVEGIFRRCANKNTCRSVRKQLENGIECGPIDVHVASSLLTELLRKLPDCLLRSRMYDQWLDFSSKTDDEGDRISSLRQLVDELPAGNLLLLRYLICILRRIARNSEQTKMTSKNLAVCLGPSLLWSKTATIDSQRKDLDRAVETIRTLIDHAIDIFGPDCLELFRDCDSCSTVCSNATLSTDQQEATGRGIEAIDHNLPQCARGSNAQSATTVSQANALVPASLDPPPVAPPRRKRSSVVVPPVFVSIAEESTSVQSAIPISADRVLKDNRPFARSLSSDSEVSGREWPVKSYGAETTDGETMEDSGSPYGETSATEEELDGQRSLMLSEDLADEEDSSIINSAVEEQKDILQRIQQNQKSDDTAAAAASRRNATEVVMGEINYSKDLATMDEVNSKKPDKQTAVDLPNLNSNNLMNDTSNSPHTSSLSVAKTRLLTEAEQKKNATPGLMSFSSTEDTIAGGGYATEKRLFFGSSFSSMAGSDADLSTFGESLDDGTAFSESMEFPGVVLRKKQMDREEVYSSSVSRIPLSSGNYHYREVSTVAYSEFDRKARENKHQRRNQLIERWDHEGELLVKAKARTSEPDRHPLSDSAADLCDSGISSVANETGGISHNTASHGTDTSDQLDSLRSTQPMQISSQSELPSRRRSLGCRDPVSVVDLCVTGAGRRTGMTHKGSHVFPALLSKTLRSRASRVYDQNGWEREFLSGTESAPEGRGKRYYADKKLASDERIIVSDIELSEPIGRSDYAPRRDHCAIRGSQNLGTPDASYSSFAREDRRQWDSDLSELNTTKDVLLEVNEEDEKISNIGRLPMKPPGYDEAVTQLKTQRQPVTVASLSSQEPSVLQEERQNVDEQTEVKKKEKKVEKQPMEDCSNRERRVESIEIEGLDASVHVQLAARSCNDLSNLSKVAKQEAVDKTDKFSRPEHGSELKHGSSLGALTTENILLKKFSFPISRKWSIRANTSSSSSNSDGDVTLHQRLEDNQAKKRIRRRKNRRSRKSRNSDTHLETDRENRVNLARSKSDSNTLLRELIVKKEDSGQGREILRKEFFRRKERALSGNVLQIRQACKESLNNDTRSRVKNQKDDDSTEYELPSTTRLSKRKSVALKDREWHKDLVREIESTQKSQAPLNPNAERPESGSQGKWQRATSDPFSTSDITFKNPNNTGRASFTVPESSKYISKTRNGNTLDYFPSVNKRSTDVETRDFEPLRGQNGEKNCPNKRNYTEKISCGGSGGGSGGSRSSLADPRVNQLKHPERDFQKDGNQSNKECTLKDISDKVATPGTVLDAQKLRPRTSTRRLEVEHVIARDRYKEKTEMQLSRELTVQHAIKNNQAQDSLSPRTPNDPCKSSVSTFYRVPVKDIVATKNSSSGSVCTKNNSVKPSVPSSFRRGEERTEVWHPETRTPVARSVSFLTHGHVTPQSKCEVETALTPELGRKAPPRTELKPIVSTGTKLFRRNSSDPSGPSDPSNRRPSSVCPQSTSVKSSSSTETESEQMKNAERAVSKPGQTTQADAASSKHSQRQNHDRISKSPWEAIPTSSASVKSSHKSPNSNLPHLETGKSSLKSAAEVACANEEGEKKTNWKESAAGLSVPGSLGSDSQRAKSTKTEMPWSVANLRSFYGNQNPQ